MARPVRCRATVTTHPSSGKRDNATWANSIGGHGPGDQRGDHIIERELRQQDTLATAAGLGRVAPAFREMANRIVYCTLATVDRRGRPRSRMVHSLWEWDRESLVGWVGSIVTPMKRAHLAGNPYVSCNFWNGAEVYDTCTAECRAELLLDEASRREGWNRFKETPPPLGYDPAMIPQWADGPASPAWGVMKLEPWYLHVFPGEFAKSGGTVGEILTWKEGEPR